MSVSLHRAMRSKHLKSDYRKNEEASLEAFLWCLGGGVGLLIFCALLGAILAGMG